MRTIGSIERILVVGIVLVIGTILIVAIKGAGDFDQAQREKQAQLAANGRGGSKKEAGAKSAERPNSAKPLNKPTLRPPPTVGEQDGAATEPPKGDPAGGELRGNAPPENGGANQEIDALVKKQLDALNGNAAGEKKLDGGAAAPPKPVADEKGEAESAPVVVDDEIGLPHPVDPKVVPPPANEPKEYVYTVQSGDSLERIARAVYGDGAEWHAILAANPQAGDGQMIRVGDKLKLPKPPTQGLDLVATTAGGAAKADAKRDAVKTPEPVTPPSSASGAKSGGFKRTGTATEHAVAKGETLMSIALDHYGTKAAWKLIYDANTDRIPDKDRIKVGVVLRLPSQ